jgi:hypothetical protein
VEPSNGATTPHPGKRARAAGGQDPGKTPKTCPSAPCQEGALLLGVVAPDGTVAYVQPPTRVSAEFVDRARALGHPERRFRFASTCIEAGCPQWTGRGCGVVDIAIGPPPDESAAMAPAAADAKTRPAGAAALPACAIRRSCRWYAQRGAAACAVCPLVVADTGGTLTYQSTRAASSKGQ